MGAFGLNASILDSSNLAWKLGLAARNISAPDVILPTFNRERRDHAKRIIRISGTYLRFICNSELPIASYADADEDERDGKDGAVRYVPGQDQEFIRDFFEANGHFLLGLDVGCKPNVVSPAPLADVPAAIVPRNGVRAPNPRVCFDANRTGYLYDVLTGAATLHIVLLASDLQGPVREALKAFSAGLAAPGSFFRRYGGRRLFNVVLLTKCAIDEAAALLKGTEFAALRECAAVLYDDRAPDEDAHTCYGVDHAKGAAVFVRPDLWVGTSAHLGDVAALDTYFGQWLLPVEGAEKLYPKPAEAAPQPIANGLGRHVKAGTNGDNHPLSNGHAELVASH
jgi:phenol 2-monooxygenase